MVLVVHCYKMTDNLYECMSELYEGCMDDEQNNLESGRVFAITGS